MNSATWLSSKILYLVQQCVQQKIGGARRDRTADLLRARQALSQLSYGPVTCLFRRLLRWLFARGGYVPVRTLPCSLTSRLASSEKSCVKVLLNSVKGIHFSQFKAEVRDA